MVIRFLRFLTLTCGIVAYPAAAQPTSGHQTARWYATTRQLDSLGASRTLGPDAVQLHLASGWNCLIRPGIATDSRRTTCTRASDTLAFSVQCDVARDNNHVQLLVRAAAGWDFVEVGCDRRGRAPPTGSDYTLYRSNLTSDSLRVQIGVFNARGAEADNRRNCDLARSLFEDQPGVRARFLCERRMYPP